MSTIDPECPKCGKIMYGQICIHCGFDVLEWAHNAKMSYMKRAKEIGL